MMTYDDRNRRMIESLHPIAQKRARVLLDNLDAIGEDVLIYSAKRTVEEQEKLYDQGRNSGGDIVTHVNDSNSYHVWGVAIDLVPVTLGRAMWKAYRRYRRIARMAMELGFDWGLQMWGFDHGHFQYTQGLTISDFKSGMTLNVQYEGRIPVSPVRKDGKMLRIRRVVRVWSRAAVNALDRLNALFTRLFS